MQTQMPTQIRKKKNVKQLLFYISLVAYPLLQWTVMYLIVNFNSILLSFKDYTYDANGMLVEQFVGLKNIIQVYIDLFTDPVFVYSWKNATIFYVLSLIFGAGVSLLFSYYIFKKRLFAGFHRVILYLPHIVSGMVITIMYKYFCEKGYPALVLMLTGQTVKGFSASLQTEFILILVYSSYIGCGANMLLYTGTMASISESVIEAAEVDGVNSFQEFWYIILPGIFPTFSLFMVTGMLTIFNGQGNLFNFYGEKAPEEFYTFGYYMFVQVQRYVGDMVHYPYLASFGLSLTFFAIPLIFTGKWLLKKYGPKAD